jgi:hypothetical protein
MVKEGKNYLMSAGNFAACGPAISALENPALTLYAGGANPSMKTNACLDRAARGQGIGRGALRT